MADSSGSQSASAIRTILVAWLLSGSLDISTALVYYPLTTPVTPVRLLQGIASGVLGARAFTGGVQTAALGIFLHYVIALSWTIVFFLACTVVRSLARHPFPVGMTYGVVVWCVMNLIVLPLSRVRRGPLTVSSAAVGAVILMFCIGLPNAIVVGRFVSRRR